MLSYFHAFFKSFFYFDIFWSNGLFSLEKKSAEEYNVFSKIGGTIIMFKKSIIALLCFSFIFLTACSFGKKKTDNAPKKTESEVETPVEEPKDTGINNLTGLLMPEEKQNLRPVAVMINNMNIAQPVQCGVNKADIVYETEVEGGITRLMAVFKDIASVDRIGPIRSARYPYVDLALGHNAVYYHCGQDPTYCAPHLKDIEDISIDTGVFGGTRIQNGLSKEHTLYSNGDKLFEGLSTKKFSTTLDSNEPWQTFGEPEEEISLTGGACNKVTVPFSGSYKTVFAYDAAKGKYTRYFGADLRKDYVTGETTDVKNVFVLMTSIVNYPDGKHRKVYLDSGDGYYFVNGTYTAIRWSKGSSNASIKITDAAGNPVKVNAGNSWVLIANTSTSKPIIE